MLWRARATRWTVPSRRSPEWTLFLVTVIVALRCKRVHAVCDPMKYHLYAPVSIVLLAVLARLRAGSISGEDVIGVLIAVSEVAAEKIGGTSGALYS